MSLASKGNQAISAVAIPLFIGAIIYLTIALTKNSRLESDVRDGKLTAETLLSEKLLVDKEITKLRSELNKLNNKNTTSDQLLITRSREIEDLQRINQALKQNNTSVMNLKREIEGQLKIKGELQREIDITNDSLTKLKSSNEDLTNLLARSQDENKTLRATLNSQQGKALNNLLVEVTKKNGKLTVKSAKTRNITLTVDVPAQSSDLSLKITRPDGRVLSSAKEEVAIKVLHTEANNPQAFYVANSPATGRQVKRVEIIYVPEEELKAGVYIVEVLDTSMSIGSLQVRLR